MDNVTTTLVLGAAGGINSGLVATGAIDKLHLAAMPYSFVLIAVAGALGGMAVVAGFRAMVEVLRDASPREQLI